MLKQERDNNDRTERENEVMRKERYVKKKRVAVAGLPTLKR